LNELESLLRTTPTEDDIARSNNIIEAIRNTDINAQHFIYEMWHATNAHDNTHVTTYVNYLGVKLRPKNVNWLIVTNYSPTKTGKGMATTGLYCVVAEDDCPAGCEDHSLSLCLFTGIKGMSLDNKPGNSLSLVCRELEKCQEPRKRKLHPT
jgi:hypothetical protein